MSSDLANIFSAICPQLIKKEGKEKEFRDEPCTGCWALCKCKPDGRYECLLEYLIDERWRDKPQDLQLKIAYEKEIIMSETPSVDQLTKKDKAGTTKSRWT